MCSEDHKGTGINSESKHCAAGLRSRSGLTVKSREKPTGRARFPQTPCHRLAGSDKIKLQRVVEKSFFGVLF